MNNFKESIKEPTDEQKKAKLVDILLKIINSPTIISSETILKDGKVGKMLSQDEFTVIYNLGVQIRGNYLYKNNKKFLESLNISEYCENDNGFLLQFVRTATEDIKLTRKLNPKNNWELNINKILTRMEGNKPDEKDITIIMTNKSEQANNEQTSNKQADNIINLNDYRD